MKRIVHLPFSCKCGRNAFELLDDQHGRCTYCGRIWNILKVKIVKDFELEFIS